MTTSNPTRTRRRLSMAMAVGLAAIMGSAIALQTPALDASAQPILMGVLGVGCLLAMPASLALAWQNWQSLRNPTIRAELHDELSVRNSFRAMAVGYIAMVIGAGYVLPLTVFVSLPITPVLTGILLAGVIAHLLSFAIFERQGDQGGDDA